jgi:hypothetical protein
MTVIGSNAIIHKRIDSTEKFVPLTLHFKRIAGVTPRRFRENANGKTILESSGSRGLDNLAL